MTRLWRNRDGIRQQFLHSEVIDSASQLAWFDAYVGKADDYVFIAENSVGQPIGQVAIYRIDDDLRTAEVGRFIAAPGEDGKGQMRRALEGLCIMAQQYWALTSVYLQVFAGNERARKLYERAGFAVTGDEGLIVRMEKHFD
ncbi:GNAT family N-acetyltransferase [Xylophilus rhododendri]|uniref:GNAT family N-acetyltransferase n=1 Tax=Xylophilus rhododendri TaxID=2697032 RepID=A0A857J1Y9_9BURK|nr:GNAT family N-acetyltransferase [Xylophilus rhododendri]QHI97920.1 GNAT family N-acetyltransferase [Xylophilus rhododendri]